HLVTLKDRAAVGIGAIIIAHMRESRSVVVEEEAIVGPGAIILPNVTIGRGAIVAAGSVVSCFVAPLMMVQGEPAKAIAHIGVHLRMDVSLKEFAKNLKPIK